MKRTFASVRQAPSSRPSPATLTRPRTSVATQPCPARPPLLPHPQPQKQATYTPSRTPISAGSSNAHRQTFKTLPATKSPNAPAASPPSPPSPPSHPPAPSMALPSAPSPPYLLPPSRQLPPPPPPQQLAFSSRTTRTKTKGCTCTNTARTTAATRASRLITAGAPLRLRLSISPRTVVIPACCRRISWARLRRTVSKGAVIIVRVARRRGR